MHWKFELSWLHYLRCTIGEVGSLLNFLLGFSSILRVSLIVAMGGVDPTPSWPAPCLPSVTSFTQWCIEILHQPYRLSATLQLHCVWHVGAVCAKYSTFVSLCELDILVILVLTMHKTLAIDWLTYNENILQPSFVGPLYIAGTKQLPTMALHVGRGLPCFTVVVVSGVMKHMGRGL